MPSRQIFIEFTNHEETYIRRNNHFRVGTKQKNRKPRPISRTSGIESNHTHCIHILVLFRQRRHQLVIEYIFYIRMVLRSLRSSLKTRYLCGTLYTYKTICVVPCIHMKQC